MLECLANDGKQPKLQEVIRIYLLVVIPNVIWTDVGYGMISHACRNSSLPYVLLEPIAKL